MSNSRSGPFRFAGLLFVRKVVCLVVVVVVVVVVSFFTCLFVCLFVFTSGTDSSLYF